MCRAEVISHIMKDDNLKKEAVKALLKDEEFKKKLAEEIFGLPIVKLGINIPGSIGEFFLEKRKRKK